jgi:ketohexokinase
MSDAGARAAGYVLGVGIATLDIVNEVATYPQEDAEVRALAQRQVRGGNVTNSLVVLSQLGHPCTWAGTLGDDPPSALVLADLDRHAIDTRLVVRHPGRCTPTSYIALSRATGTRTIVHHRDLPELAPSDLAAGLTAQWDWLGVGCAWVHFEGRNPVALGPMLRLVRDCLPGVPVSVELEKVRPGGEQLPDGLDLILFSRAYASAMGAADPVAFLADQARRSGARHCALAWGEQGAYGWTQGAGCAHVPAWPPARLVDTLAAGDVFNAAVIDGLLRGCALPAALGRANHLAGYKCGRQGLLGLVEDAVAAGFR